MRLSTTAIWIAILATAVHCGANLQISGSLGHHKDEKADIKCPPPSPDGNYNVTFYPNEEDCTKYWECDNGNLIEGQCPDGLVWVPEEDVCDWEYLHPCDTSQKAARPVVRNDAPSKMTPTDQHPVSEITCPPPSPDGNYNVTFYPNEDDCTKYWECDNGKVIEGQCPDGLVWVPGEDICDWEYLHPCDTTQKAARPDIKRPSPAKMTPLAEITCPPPRPDGNYNATYYPNEDDCTKYWECDNGKLIDGQCPDGLVWVPDQNTCDWEYLHPCDTARKATRLIKNYGARGKMAPIHHHPLADVTCPPPSPDGNYNATYYPNEEDCTKYWECDNGKLIEGQCPDGLVWVPDQNTCDWEYLHPCDTASGPERPIKKLALPAKMARFHHIP